MTSSTLLNKAVAAIINNAYQDRSFSDSCSITGDDFQVCLFCGADNLEAAKKNVSVAITHKPDCVYLEALAYSQLPAEERQ
jgi:hypothetical protein